MTYTPERITTKTIDELLGKDALKTTLIGETTFYETIFLHTIKARFPRTTETFPPFVYNGGMIAPVYNDFIQLVDEYLISKHMYLTLVNHVCRGKGFFTAKTITGQLYTKRE